jgi:spore protease
MNKFVHTDLAIEERERFEKNIEIFGVEIEKKKIGEKCVATKMVIRNDTAASKMNKSKGTYLTIECDDISKSKKEISCYLENVLRREVEKIKPEKILIVGLGNDRATPDSLGPKVVERIKVTENVCCIAPGVYSKTGMETFNIVHGVADKERIDMIIAIDSLAARNVSRIARTVQYTDTGIVPGSGVGNHRVGLNREMLKIPVVAIGIPTVINCVNIVHDSLNQILQLLNEYEQLKKVTDTFGILSSEEKYEFIEDIMAGGMGNMYVTPKDIDELIDITAQTVADIINKGINLYYESVTKI